MPVPPRKYSPVPIWWWSGDEVTEERIAYQMEEMAGHGLYGAMIMNVAPVASLFGKDADNPSFMSPRWWELFEFTCKKAKKLGMFIWFYDQIGFSGANFQAQLVKKKPSYSGLKLESSETETAEGTLLGAPEGMELLAAFDKTEDPFLYLPVKDGKVSVEGGRKIRLVFCQKAGFDYFSEAGCRELLDQVHGEFERRCGQWFGDVIVGSFQDELPPMSTWGYDFAKQFQAEKGYDLIPNLIYLYEGEGKQAERTRRDYQDIRAKLSEKAFFRPFFEWHRARSLTCGIDQGGLARGGHTQDGIYYYADYMRNMRWYDNPGSDLMGESKIHSSIATICGRNRVWLESFHSTGWGGTLEETFDWLLPWYRSGANLYNPHGFYYSTKGGFWEWAPPSTCWRQPYWKHYRQFADTVTRMSAMLTGGEHVCEVGILYPSYAAQSMYSPLYQEAGMAGVDPRAEKIQSTYEHLIGLFNMHGRNEIGLMYEECRDFDIVAEFMVEEGLVGTGSYKMMILPYCTSIGAESAKMLVEFVKNGGTLLAVGVIPYAIEPEAETAVQELNTLFADKKAVLVEECDGVVPYLKKLGEPMVEAPVATMHRKRGTTNILFVPATKRLASEDMKLGLAGLPDMHSYNFSPDHYIRNMKVTIHNCKHPVYEMNLLNGEVEPAIFDRTGENVTVTLPFQAVPATILLWDETDFSDCGPSREKQSREIQKLSDTYQYQVIETMQNRYGDFTKPNFEGSPAMATWFFDHGIEGNAEIGKEQATFGRYAWMIQGAADELPGPASEMESASLLESVKGWMPVEYSKTRGINKDMLHLFTLGPSGHIPEEFLRVLPALEAGQGAQFRTGIQSEEEQSFVLAVGANCKKRIWLNGKEISCEDAGYLVMEPVTLQKGMNVLDLQFIAEEGIMVRGYYSGVVNAEEFARPEWLKTDDQPKVHDHYAFSCEFDLEELPVKTDISYGSANAICDFRINGERQDMMGGFKPYDSGGAENGISHYNGWKIGKKSITFDLTIKSAGSLTMDENEDAGAVENIGKGITGNVFFDGILQFADGTEKSILSGRGWKMRTPDGKTVEARMDPYARVGVSGLAANPASFFIRHRSCPLPGFEWLEEDKNITKTLDLQSDAGFGISQKEWFEWKIPSAATKAYLKLNGTGKLYLDGTECELADGAALMPGTEKAYYQARLEVTPLPGYTGGAIWQEPVTYETGGTGTICLGEWAEQGLESWSGGISYQLDTEIEKSKDGRTVLDLGAVRGTAEVSVNGSPAGSRFLSPYRFDITDYITEGVNHLTINVYNTLAPYMDAAGATRYVPAMQKVSGMFGPVTVQEER